MVWDEIIAREKRTKIAKTGAQAVGLGVGAIILQFFFHSENGDTVVREAFNKLGITLIIYGIAVLTVFLFKPERLRAFYAVATYFIVPIPVIMFVMDIVHAIMKKS